MALESYALISEAEFRDRWNATGATQGPQVQAAINTATLAIEAHLGGRLLVSRGSITEYHSIYDRLSTIFVGDYPIIGTPTVVEDTAWPRTYSGSALVSGTDFEQVGPDQLRRLSGGPTCWPIGSRVVRLTYTAGYASTAAVPHDLKQVAFYVAAMMYREADRKQFGISAMTDAVGNWQRTTGYFPPEIDNMLASYRRYDVHRTWERAA